jgi:hypothetical protein
MPLIAEPVATTTKVISVLERGRAASPVST